MPYMLRLPDERGAQLRQIAEKKNTTVSELITDYIRSEIEAGTIPSNIPGINVAKAGESIAISAPGFEASVPLQEGQTLADLLRKSAALSPSDFERKKQWFDGLAGLSGVTLKRMGAGVRIVSPVTGAEYPLASGVAEDLATEIERAAK
ncbi:hypothetical protein ACTTAF_12135 [Rhodobacter capsulatus]|uniref:hypothetical protein n=1 Tax=Rhodobacter capsulatus TaxID=1061 RepID=UPI00042005D8|nr:hypothetical protein [Rhodobacter capsulatus]